MVSLDPWVDPLEFVNVTGWVYGVIVGITMCFTVTAPEFPYMGEWGKYIWEWELSGYPNSPMSFYAVLVPVLLAAVKDPRGWDIPRSLAGVFAWLLRRY